MTDSTFDFCILGAGLAGLSLADALTERNCRVCVIEKNEIASGASGTPLGMVNPATGRRATKTWRAEQCYEAVYKTLWKVAPFSEEPFFTRNGVLRPALTEKIARKMKNQLEKTAWPHGWCEWLSREQIQRKHPGINCVEGGLWLPVGLTVDVTQYLQALARYLETQGATVIEHADYQLNQTSAGWTVSLETREINCDKLVFATGFDMTRHPFWDFLPLHPIKGQMAIFQPDEPLPFEHSISSLGYIAHIGNQWYAQGSTYEHDFESLNTDEYGEEYLRNRLRRTLPELEANSTLVGQWAGVRISTPNRKPVLGEHPGQNHLYAYTGLGSKGLMYGKFLANHYADHLLDGRTLFDAVDIQRFEEG
ncbi:NAD(P)/FAD-dependent oxidoreductase [Halalkalibaculum sp. DA3122]|uniref:NAD(P)/FAD-dependent oxidoreductase n=1 Tax=unclassified Halalkalibaculum TaxID=2964617 RepID=UPI003754A5D5